LAEGAGFDEHSGAALALSADGSTLAVGAWGNDPGASTANTGIVRLFARTGSTWSSAQELFASNAGSQDRFGISVDLSADGTTLAVGASHEDSNAIGVGGSQTNNSASAAGAVYVFALTPRGGVLPPAATQEAYIKASNTGSGDAFGSSVSLSGDGATLAVGARYEDSNATGAGGSQTSNSAPNAGAAYVFTRAGTTWSQQAYVKASNTDASDGFGAVVSLSDSGSTLAVSAPWEDSASSIIGAGEADDMAVDAGAVYLFTRAGATWSQHTYAKASNTQAGDQFGDAIELSADGLTLAVGASGEDSAVLTGWVRAPGDGAADAGAVYAFTFSSGSWSLIDYIKASNTDLGDSFGANRSFLGMTGNRPGGVALSADGSVLACGAGGEDSTALGVDGDQTNNGSTNTGAVYVFW
jgi:hypothetical protein